VKLRNSVLLILHRNVRLYQDSNIRKDEMKDDSRFKRYLVGREPTLASGLSFRGQ